MSRPSSVLARSLRNRLTTLEMSRVRVEALAGERRFALRATEHMYEGLFLNAHRAFESFLEDLFLGLLVEGRGFSSCTATPRIAVKSHRVAREVVAGRRAKYMDWLPYDRTVELAKVFFRGGRPFSDLSTGLKKQIDSTVVLRNAIAHRSRHSQERFRREILTSVSLPPRQRTPAGYLRDVHAVSPSQTRYELMIAQLQQAANELTR